MVYIFHKIRNNVVSVSPVPQMIAQSIDSPHPYPENNNIPLKPSETYSFF